MHQFETLSPVDGRVYTTRKYASESDILETLKKARQAYDLWRKVPLKERQAKCLGMLNYFLDNKAEIAQEITWQMGRPMRYAEGEIDGLVERASHMITVSEQALADIKLAPKPGFQRFIRRESLGVVAVLAPWNYPYLTAVNAIIPAILAGNVVILKHSAQTPLCAERFKAAFDAVGLPEGVFQYLHIDHARTGTLISSPMVNHIAFTGSVAGGSIIEATVAGQFKSVGLELGGKDPAYVRPDADLEHAVETIVDGAFFNSGQSCCGIERAYVHEQVYDEFVRASVDLVNRYVLGRPTDPETTLGPLVKAAAAEFVREQIADAVASGAKALIDESNFAMSRGGTPYLAPQLLVEVNHSMRIMTEESFGPVLGIQKVSGDEEAIRLMNDSEFGLTAAIFTRDMKAGAALAEQVDAGTVYLNRCDYLDPALAWTGVKNSGKGCTLSNIGFDQLTRPKSFHFKYI